jgi:peptidoglycan/xylan/chitin deacetylase (PgdA/CDA1 family)
MASIDANDATVRAVSLCRADKILLGGAAIVGSSALLTAAPLTVGASAAFLALLTDGIFRPSSSVFYPTVSNGPRDRPQVALTFDDGPDPLITPRILDALQSAGARATFFVIGRHLAKHREIGLRALRDGHELGNHSWMHSYFQNFYGNAQQRADMERSTRLIQELSGSDAQPLYRPPVGLKSPALARVAHARKLKVIAWSLHSRDTFARDAAATAAGVLARIAPGDIVLMHDGHERDGQHRDVAVAALPAILRGLQERGLRCVTVSELLRS